VAEGWACSGGRRWKEAAEGRCWWRRRLGWSQAGPDLGRTGLVLGQEGLDAANPAEPIPCCTIASTGSGLGGVPPTSEKVPPTSEKVEALLWLQFSGEFRYADKFTGLTGDVVALVIVRLCPWASWRGCFFAVVCGLGWAVLRGVKLW
jgi:hypothetical protein